ncbi:MAG TPA: hypothetical protein VIY86_02005, partial [Pirellulaceae bacterium]
VAGRGAICRQGRVQRLHFATALARRWNPRPPYTAKWQAAWAPCLLCPPTGNQISYHKDLVL